MTERKKPNRRNSKPAPKRSTRIDLHVGACLQALRKKHGATRQALGKHLGTSSTQVLKYELGIVRLDPKHLFEISRLFDVPVKTFFDGLI